MVRKKKIVKDLTPRFYAHYDAVTNEIVSVNNFRHDGFTDAIEIDYVHYEKLILGHVKFNDFTIGTVIDSEGNPKLGLVSKYILEGLNFKNRLLKWIDKEIENSEIDVHWDEFNSQWVFNLSNEFRQKYYDNRLPISTVSFFIILGNDPNFIIRVIDLEFSKLILDKVVVKFETKWEQDISRISLTASLASIKYSLKIWKIHEQD
jgi:hypothetical protein